MAEINYGGPVKVAGGDTGRGCRRFGGKVALLTGAARGIGFASAVRLAGEGARVCITDRDARALEEAVGIAAAAGVQLHSCVMDSSDAGDVAQRIEEVSVTVGGIDILVNNAGGSLHTPFQFMQESDADWQRVMDLNLMGAVWASKAVLPGMIAKRYGRIVNFGSKAGRYGSLIAGANYAAAKGAVASMTRQMAQEFGPMGITVNSICPGVVMTERTSSLWSERRTAEEREQVLATIPVRRYCEVDDVAATVAFLASDDSAFITGASLDLNGGQAMA
ncbi:glucose 1-dehydrogenase [Ramlibacter monticola]|uniref:SDR family oxidoreductase n=1 Tax=Ramlibacter monticola TaxID=1926872 RepID=A0A937CTU2_9BURK|nr:SDR family oxidoreductase [Ramlibacter monticola]MBL0392985.1 SDR family oxidoreductase [Ramlibacter monticola]